MDAQRWRRISALFDGIVELAEPARSQALDRACTNDPSLRAELTALLRRDAEAELDAPTLLHSPGHVAVEWAESGNPGDEDVAGLRIGRWRVLRELGRGGMGVVYLAGRADGEFEQRAALKLIRTDDDSAGLRRRFLRERQILADLEHPNIARVLDGGIADDGRPYFAMEYVDGEPLLDYVGAHDCDARTRLRLFLEICEAVQFAHRRLVVHRDIKPSNVLVTADGTVKLLDFGVATLLVPSTSDDTQTRIHAFTPAYAAPEQLRGGVVTTAADIYALGVLLYELLSGERPYRLDESATPVEWARLIDGPLCSSPSVAVAAAHDPARLPRVPPLPARMLHGDLDIIVLTALRREPERRYASVEALAADVQNYLADRPITARADSARYVIGKFIGRHRVGTAAAVIATLVLFAALGAALLEAHRARQQAQRARSAAALAQQQTHRAEAVRQFLVAVFEQTEPDANGGKALTAHELLERGEQQIGRGPHDAALDADASALLADLYEQIGDFDRAQQLLKRALAASEGSALPDDIRARVLIGVAGVEDDNDDYDVAILHARQGMQLLQESMPASAELTAKAHNIVAHCLIGKGDGPAAEALLRDALAHDVAALGDRNESVAEEWVELGTVLGNAGSYDESEAAFERGIDSWRAVFGENSYHVAHALNELSNMLSDKGDFAGAERALRRSLAIRMETVGPQNRDTLIVEHNLLVTMELEGRIAESLPQRLGLIDRANGSAQMHPPDLGSYYTAAGKDLRDLGRFAEADAMLARSIAVYEKAYGKASAQSANPVRARGTTRMLEGRYAEAEDDLAGALAIVLAHAPSESPQVAAARADLGTLLRLMHKRDDALAMLKQANDAFGKMSSPDRGQVVALAGLSETELDGGDAAAARASAESALVIARKTLPPGHFMIATALFALGRADLAERRFADAEALLREALSLRALEPAADPRVLEVKVALVDALEGEGRIGAARALKAEIEPSLRASRSPYAAELRARLATATPAANSASVKKNQQDARKHPAGTVRDGTASYGSKPFAKIVSPAQPSGCSASFAFSTNPWPDCSTRADVRLETCDCICSVPPDGAGALAGVRLP